MKALFGRISYLAGAVALALSLLAGPAAAEKITVLNWQGYGTDEKWATDAFTKETGIEVVHDYFNSEQEALTKLRTSPGAYDVVLINSAFTLQAADEGLIQPADSAKISNFADLAPDMRDSAYLNKGGKVYGVAWVWGVTSVAYNTKVVKQKPDSIGLLWDKSYKGRVSVRDDAVEAVSIAALATGQDMNNPADLGAVREKLRALKPQIRMFWSSEDEWNKSFTAGDFDVAIYWSGSAARSKKAFGLPVGYYIPKEGAIGWFDGLSVATGAPNPDGAHKFIDYMVDPKFYVRWDNEVGAPASANVKAMQQLPADAFNRTVLGDAAAVARLQFMSPLSDETREKFLELWEETKAYYAQ